MNSEKIKEKIIARTEAYNKKLKSIYLKKIISFVVPLICTYSLLLFISINSGYYVGKLILPMQLGSITGSIFVGTIFWCSFGSLLDDKLKEEKTNYNIDIGLIEMGMEKENKKDKKIESKILNKYENINSKNKIKKKTMR
mgnify:CR=1 FL=1